MVKGIIVIDDIPKCCSCCPIEHHFETDWGDEYGFACPFKYKGHTEEIRKTGKLRSCPIKNMSKEIEMLLFRERKM